MFQTQNLTSKFEPWNLIATSTMLTADVLLDLALSNSRV